MEHIIYTALADELMNQESKDFMDGLGLPQIASVALFNNQYRFEKQELAYPLPAVFIEFGAAVYQDEGRNTQQVDDRIRVHIEQKNFASTEYNSHNKAIALEVLQVINAIHQIISNISIPELSRLSRVGRELDTDHGNAPVHIFEYSVNYVDCETDKYGEYESTTENTVLATSKHLVPEITVNDDDAENPYIID